MTKELLEFEKNEEPAIDMIAVFTEGLSDEQKVQAFTIAADRLRARIEQVATPENVQKINDTYDLKLVLNQHGNGVHVGQSLQHITNPFITFIEAASAKDIDQDPLFAESVDNAFGVKYNGQAPKRPNFSLVDTPQYSNSWHYWQQRGLLAKASIISPVDIKSDALRLVNTLFDADYSQEFLNQTIPLEDLRSRSYEELLDQARLRGLLIMHSNAVRELTSTLQITDRLLKMTDFDELKAVRGEKIAERVTSLRQKAERGEGKLGAYIMYGTAHHGIVREFRSRGINIERVFADEWKVSPFKFIGDAEHQFFNGRHSDPSEEKIKRFAQSVILESLLMQPLVRAEEYGLQRRTVDFDKYLRMWYSLSKLAMNQALHEQLPEIVERYQKDPFSSAEILRENGFKQYLTSLDDPS